MLKISRLSSTRDVKDFISAHEDLQGLPCGVHRSGMR